MRLADLSQELLELDETDVCSFRLACRTLAESLSQIVCRRLKFFLQHLDDRVEIIADMRKLEMLVDGKWPQVTQGARILVLRPFSGREDIALSDLVQPLEFDEATLQELSKAEARVEKLLPFAVATLKGVHTVDWELCYSFDPEIRRRLMDAIVTLPNIRHVTLFSPGLKAELYGMPLVIARLPPLVSLHIHYTSTRTQWDNGRDETLDHLSKAIANSPHLSSLTVRLPHKYSGSVQLDPATSLHALLKHTIEKRGPALRLKTLELSGFSARLDGDTLPHLLHLRSLTLTRFVDPELDQKVQPVLEDGTQDSNDAIVDFAGPFPDLWKALMTAGVKLAQINVSHMSNAFVEYVGSYSGLEDLKLYVPNGRWWAPTKANVRNAYAEGFWDAIGRNHGETLRHLDVISRFEGEWCFSERRSSALKRCWKLVTFKIGVATSQFEYDSEHPAKVQFFQSCHDMTDLLDIVALNMPMLDQLTVSARTSYRRRYPGLDPITHTRALELINKAVAEYSAPVFCKHLPDLDIEVYRRRKTWKSSHRRSTPAGGFNSMASHLTDVLRSSVVCSFRRFSRLDELFYGDRFMVGHLPPVRKGAPAYHSPGGDDDPNLHRVLVSYI